MDDTQWIRTRLSELDRQCYERNILRTSGFLSLHEQEAFHGLLLSGSFRCETKFLWGGTEDAERSMAFFLPDYLDIETAKAESLRVVSAEAGGGKFAEALTHRDYLGALMHLGIERDCLGDILVEERHAWIFCTAEIADFIASELLKVRHTSVRCKIEQTASALPEPKLEELTLNVASGRLDAVLAALYRLSRQKASSLIEAEQVSVSGRAVSSSGRELKPGDRVSVRGFGKFIYDGVDGSSRKGRLFVRVRRYV